MLLRQRHLLPGFLSGTLQLRGFGVTRTLSSVQHGHRLTVWRDVGAVVREADLGRGVEGLLHLLVQVVLARPNAAVVLLLPLVDLAVLAVRGRNDAHLHQGLEHERADLVECDHLRVDDSLLGLLPLLSLRHFDRQTGDVLHIKETVRYNVAHHNADGVANLRLPIDLDDALSFQRRRRNIARIVRLRYVVQNVFLGNQLIVVRCLQQVLVHSTHEEQEKRARFVRQLLDEIADAPAPVVQRNALCNRPRHR